MLPLGYRSPCAAFIMGIWVYCLKLPSCWCRRSITVQLNAIQHSEEVIWILEVMGIAHCFPLVTPAPMGQMHLPEELREVHSSSKLWRWDSRHTTGWNLVIPADSTAGARQQQMQYSSQHLFRMEKLAGSSHHAAASCSHTVAVKYSLKLHPCIRHPYSHLTTCRRHRGSLI